MSTAAVSPILSSKASRGRRSSRYGLTNDYYSQGGNYRDLSALLSFGSPALPWTNAWTDNRIEQVRAFKLWTYVAINVIAKRVASQVPNVSWVRLPGSKPHDAKALLHPLRRTKALLPLQSHEQLEAVPHQHPCVRLLQSPNNEDTSYDLWYETLLFLFLTGSAYWWTPLNHLGLPYAIHVVPSHWVWPVLGNDSDDFIEEWEIRPVEGNYLRRRFPREEFTVFRFKNPLSKIDGYSPTTAGANWHDVSASLNRARVFAYDQGTFANISIQFDGKLQDPTDEQLRRIEAKFYQRAIGPNKAGRPLFLPPGVVAKPLNILPNQMVFGETANETRDNTLALYGVPLPVVHAGDQTYGGNAASQASFHTNTINPLCKFLGLSVTEKFGYRYDESLRIWWEQMTAEDPQLAEDQIQTDMMGAAITPNEIRIMRGREPLKFDWADMPIFPSSMTGGTLPFGGRHHGDSNPPSIKPAQKPRDPDDNKKRRAFPPLSEILF